MRPEEQKSHVGELFVQLHEYEPATTPALLDAIRSDLAAYPRAKLRLERFQNGPPIDAPIEMRVFSEDLEGLRVLASKVAAVIKGTPGAMYVDDPLRVTKTDLAVRIDSAQAGRLGVPELEIENAVRLAITLSQSRFATRPATSTTSA